MHIQRRKHSTARRFFREVDKVAEITGLDPEFLRKLQHYFRALTSGDTFKIEALKICGEETMAYCVSVYPWYYIPVAVHKALVHGWQGRINVQSPASKQIFLGSSGHGRMWGVLEWCQKKRENLQKNTKKLDFYFQGKIQEKNTMADLFTRRMVASDPYINLTCPLNRCCKRDFFGPYPAEVTKLFRCDLPQKSKKKKRNFLDFDEEEEPEELEVEDVPELLNKKPFLFLYPVFEKSPYRTYRKQERS
eukprot:Pompholyxophrys_punicea_v1_NODE_668_length_1488_cov_4.501047.p1 type:complete len:248 gc:universal NODE_668_length_1488_cov_4.501047:785-42(-)